MRSSASTPPDLPPLLPVMDLMRGRVVQGIAGRRESYQPLVTPLTDTADPREMARALRRFVGHDWMYVADLDAIEQDTPDWESLRQLADDGARLLVDAGLRNAQRARQLVEIGATHVVAALETLPGPQVLADIVAAIGAERTLFSLDLKDGRTVAATGWQTTDPIRLVAQVVTTGIGGLIVLDVAGVGVAEGVPTRDFCRELHTVVPQLSLITGGGVRHIDDVRQLLADGVDSVLVASALHRGTIRSEDLAELLP